MADRILELKPVFCEFIPNELTNGIIYISEEYGSAVHPCACGCMERTVLPFKKGQTQNDDFNWGYTNNDGVVTFTPSIGNWKIPCRSHYNITDNKVIWHADSGK